MIPIAEMRYSDGSNGAGEREVFQRGDLVFVLGYMENSAVVMHPTKGWAKVPLYCLIPKGFRTHVGAVP